MADVYFRVDGDRVTLIDGADLLTLLATQQQGVLIGYVTMASGSADTASKQAAIATAQAAIAQAAAGAIVPTIVGAPVQVVFATGTADTDRALGWLDDQLRLEMVGGLGPIAAASIGVDLSGTPGALIDLFNDGSRTWVWLDRGQLDAPGLGPVLQAQVQSIARVPAVLPQTSGTALQRSRAVIGHLARATVRTQKLHYALIGDSMIERTPLPQGIVDDFRVKLGIPIVASGWLGFANSQLGDGTDTATLSTSGRTLLSIVDGDDGGQWSPEGSRVTHAAGDGTAGATIHWKGKRLTLYHLANGAAFSQATDGSAAQALTTGTGGAIGKTTVTAASEGWHTTVLTRPDPSVKMEWYGTYATSDLPGLTVSKIGNAGTSFANWVTATATAAGSYILTDIAPDMAQINLIGNDALQSYDPAVVATLFRTLVAKLRATRSGIEMFLGFRSQNGLSGYGAGRLFSDYVPAMLAACDDLGVDMINHGAALPPQPSIPFFYLDDNRHLLPEGGGGAWLAAAQRRAFWECQ